MIPRAGRRSSRLPNTTSKMHEIHTKTCTGVPLEAVKCNSGFGEISKDYAAYLTDESKYPGGKAEELFFSSR